MDIVKKLKNGEIYVLINHENKPLDFAKQEAMAEGKDIKYLSFDYYNAKVFNHVYSSRLLSFVEILNNGSYQQKEERLKAADCAIRLEHRHDLNYEQISFNQLYEEMQAVMVVQLTPGQYELKLALSENECYSFDIIGIGEFAVHAVKKAIKLVN
jgi:hypothetical protein